MYSLVEESVVIKRNLKQIMKSLLFFFCFKALYQLDPELTASTQSCVNTIDNPLDTRAIIVM